MARMTVATRDDILRLAAEGLTKAEIAKRAGVDQSKVEKMENWTFKTPRFYQSYFLNNIDI